MLSKSKQIHPQEKLFPSLFGGPHSEPIDQVIEWSSSRDGLMELSSSESWTGWRDEGVKCVDEHMFSF